MQLESSWKEFLEISYPANDQLAKAHEAISHYHHARKDLAKAIEHAKQQLEFAQPYDKGKVLNRIASLHDHNGQSQEATAARQEVVRLFRTRLTEKPERSAFGMIMVTELFEAIYRIPTATFDEKQAVADLVLNHEIVTAQTKDNVRKRMAELRGR